MGESTGIDTNMIIWITGQPGSGKTTLAKALPGKLETVSIVLDGAAFRKTTGNQDYSRMGRIMNADAAMKKAEEWHKEGVSVICAFVSPYRNQREFFKLRLWPSVFEVYLQSRDCRKHHVADYEPPLDGYLHLKAKTDIRPADELAENIVNWIIQEQKLRTKTHGSTKHRTS